MRLRLHPSPEYFLAEAQAHLELREIEQSLLLGAVLALRRIPAQGASPLLATVHRGDALVAAAVRAGSGPLVVTAEEAMAGEALEPIVAEVLRSEPTPPAVHAAEPADRAFADLWEAATGSRPPIRMRQRLHALADLEPVPPAPGRLRPATDRDLETVAGWMLAFEREALGTGSGRDARAAAERRVGAGEIYLWEDGVPRGMAARARPTRRTVAVNAVYTPPEQRGRGYATACVAALSRLLLAEFRWCVLFTDLANPTSNAIYARIGYRPVQDHAVRGLAGSLPAPDDAV